MNTAGSVAYVTDWGGRVPRPGDRTAPAGDRPNADRVVVDRRGIASSGTVTRVDLTTMRSTHSIAVGLHPTAIVWDEPRRRVYVANGNSDAVSIIDSDRNEVVRTLYVNPFRERVPAWPQPRWR